MRRLLFFGFLFLCHCQSCAGISSNPILEEASMPDADADAALDAVDGDRDAGACDPTKPFSSPQALADLNTPGSETNPVLTEDETELFYLSDVGQTKYNGVIYRAVPPFKKGTIVAELEPPPEFDVSGLAISPDGLTLVFARFDTINIKREVFVTTRPTRALPFATPKLLSGANDSMLVPFEVALAPTSADLYLSEQRLGIQVTNLWSTVKVDGGYATPIQLWDASGQVSPAIAWNELTLYFAQKGGGGPDRGRVGVDALADGGVGTAVESERTERLRRGRISELGLQRRLSALSFDRRFFERGPVRRAAQVGIVRSCALD